MFGTVKLSIRQTAFCVVLIASAVSAAKGDGRRLPRSTPQEVGLDASIGGNIDRAVAKGIESGQMPGCVVAVGRHGRLALLKAYGDRQTKPAREKMTVDTLFDMASLTKPIATATSIMILVQEGRVRLRDRVSRHLPEFAQNEKSRVTVHQLLTHQGGLIPDNALKDYLDGPKDAMKRIHALSLVEKPGERFIYTDVGFIVLAEIVHRVSGKNVDEFARAKVFEPLGMSETGYRPAAALRKRAAATEQRDGKWMKGEVHDPRAFHLGGVAGHAGLFSTADDLAIYAQMLLNRGAYRGARVLGRRTVAEMTRDHPVSRGIRGLGWDKSSPYSSNRGEFFSKSAFGHGGFTGTSMWIDPELDLFVIFLSNRLHPDGKGSVNNIAGSIGTIVSAAISDETSDESRFEGKQTSTGIDVLRDEKFVRMRGKKIGLITNQTGIDRFGVSTIRLLHEAPDVHLAALFSPEHGIEGKLDVPRVADSRETSTGLKVFSLYGATRRPTKESLQGLDALVFDIQDIGARFYTYVSTMGNALRAADEQKMQFFVLDRPNPINGLTVSGPVLDDGKQSFVGYHTLPIRHGMTVGELATMLRAELELNAVKLHVVPLRNWRRRQFHDTTGLPWINPSPNMRNLNQALLYPGVGLLETTNLSVGRGTDTPFEILGAPWLDGRGLARRMNGLSLAGVRFTPIWFTPESSVHKNQRCGGVRITITRRADVRPISLGLEIARQIRAMHPNDWKADRYGRLLGNDQALRSLLAGETTEQILLDAQPKLDDFLLRRSRFLLYDD